MPLPGQQMVVGRSESEDLQEAVALSLAGHPKQLEDTPAPAQPPEAGISFAHMARMGYAATGIRPVTYLDFPWQFSSCLPTASHHHHYFVDSHQPKQTLTP